MLLDFGVSVGYRHGLNLYIITLDPEHMNLMQAKDIMC